MVRLGARSSKAFLDLPRLAFRAGTLSLRLDGDGRVSEGLPVLGR